MSPPSSPARLPTKRGGKSLRPACPGVRLRREEALIVFLPVEEELNSPRATRTREHQRQFRGMPPIPESG